VLGGSGAYPMPDVGCSGYLVEDGDFRLLVDPGYGTVGELMRRVSPSALDAVYVSHRHPDHCADLNPLLRARAMDEVSSPPMPVYAPVGALDVVLALDRPGMLEDAYDLHEFDIGDAFAIGPLRAQTRELPHFVPNAAIRLAGAGGSVVYTGDGGPDPALVELARDADLLVAEATYIDDVPADSRGLLCDARTAGRQAEAAGVRGLMLTHLWPGDDPDAVARAAAAEYAGPIQVARPGVTVDLA
jgi:ribonuclease BN (tRNA processing enzyme)